jgi:hypothetical protein
MVANGFDTDYFRNWSVFPNSGGGWAMFREIGKLQLNFPLWFVSESRDSLREGTRAVGVRGQTGFLMLPLFTSENLAKQFVEDQHLKNVVIVSVDDSHGLVSFLKESSTNFTFVVLNPSGSKDGARNRWTPMPLEYVLRGVEKELR